MVQLQLEITMTTFTRGLIPYFRNSFFHRCLNAPLKRVNMKKKNLGKSPSNTEHKGQIDQEIDNLAQLYNQKRKTYLATYCFCENVLQVKAYLKSNLQYVKKSLEDQTRQEGKRKKSITRSKERALPNPYEKDRSALLEISLKVPREARTVSKKERIL